MSYKHYVTYICCVILNNIQILFQASRTYIHIHEWIFFSHLLLRIQFNGTTWTRPWGGEPEVHLFFGGTCRLQIWGYHVQARGLRVSCSKCMDVSKRVYVPTVRPEWRVYSYSLLVSNSSQDSDSIYYPRRLVLNFTQGSCVPSGDLIQNMESVHTKYLCVQLRLILHLEVSVSSLLISQ